jgi:hypothetical protein
MKELIRKRRKVFAIHNVMHRYFTKCKQFYWIPKLSYTGAGYPKPQKGVMVMWLGWCKQIKKPINERF